MSVQSITLNLPDEVYQRAEMAARTLKRPIDELIAETLATTLPQLSLIDDVPMEMANEIAAMSQLSDEALLGLANSLLPAERQEILNGLLDQQNRGTLSDAGHRELIELTAECGRHILRRAKAVAILMSRGRSVPQLLSLPTQP